MANALPQIERNAILRQIYEVADAGRNFAYAHLRPDDEAAIYTGFGTPELAAALIRQSQGKAPLTYPENLIFYRQAFHQHLATDSEFLHTLTQRGANRRRFFRDMEKAVRVCFEEMLAMGEAAPTLPPARVYSSATTHARDLTRLYFRSVSLALTLLRLMYREEDSSDREAMERLYGTLWAVDLAGAYTSGLLAIDFHPAQLIEVGQAPGAEGYTTRALNLVFDAGFHIARRMANEVFPQIPRLQANYSQLTQILSEEMTEIGRLQHERGCLTDPEDAVSAKGLVADALSHYQEDVLHNLTLKCAERRLNQERANRAMQQALAGKSSPAYVDRSPVERPPEVRQPVHRTENEPRYRERDLEQEKEAAKQAAQAQEQAPAQQQPDAKSTAKAQATAIMSGLAAMGSQMGEKTSRTVIDEGHKIIEYLRRLQMGGAAGQHAEGMGPSIGGNSDSSSESTGGDKKENQSQDLENMEFEVRIQGEEKRKHRLRDILSALLAGKHVTFASKAQALTFSKACMALTGKRPGFPPNLMRYIDKGRLHDMTHQILEEMAIEFELQTHMMRNNEKQQQRAVGVGEYVEKSTQRHQSDDYAAAAFKEAEKIEKGLKHTATIKEAPDPNKIVR